MAKTFDLWGTPMATVKTVMADLKKKSSERTRNTLIRHGAPENLFGVSVADLKAIAKQIKGEQQLALDLYATGNADAMYLAGMVANGSQMTKKQLDDWAKAAPYSMISDHAVPGVATESEHARALAIKWIKSKNEEVASCGWNTYSGIVATRNDDELDLPEIEGLLDLIVEKIHTAANRIRYTMNGFVIAVGSFVPPLLEKAKQAANTIGTVSVDMGDTACKVPLASEYIEKVESMDRVGKKRKTIKC